MKYLIGIFHEELGGKRYIIQSTEDIILEERKEPKHLWTQYQVFNDTQVRRNQKVNINQNNKLKVKTYPKTKKN